MAARTKIIACQVFEPELRSLLPADVEIDTLQMSLHERPRSLRELLQQRIDATTDCDTIIVGYGMCGQATVGLRATHCRLVLPRVDDCIGMFLGSRAAYRAQHDQEPGTYFLTRGWIGAGVTTPFAAYDAVRERWGAERAERVMGTMLGHYRRLAFVRTTGADGADSADGADDVNSEAGADGAPVGETASVGETAPVDETAQARGIARRFGLSYAEIEGSRELVHPLLYGPWDERFVVVPAGGTVGLRDFLG